MSSTRSTEDWEWSAFDVVKGRIVISDWQAFNPEIALMTIRLDGTWTTIIDASDMTVAWNARFAGQDAFRLIFIRKR